MGEQEEFERMLLMETAGSPFAPSHSGDAPFLTAGLGVGRYLIDRFARVPKEQDVIYPAPQGPLAGRRGAPVAGEGRGWLTDEPGRAPFPDRPRPVFDPDSPNPANPRLVWPEDLAEPTLLSQAGSPFGHFQRPPPESPFAAPAAVPEKPRPANPFIAGLRDVADAIPVPEHIPAGTRVPGRYTGTTRELPLIESFGRHAAAFLAKAAKGGIHTASRWLNQEPGLPPAAERQPGEGDPEAWMSPLGPSVMRAAVGGRAPSATFGVFGGPTARTADLDKLEKAKGMTAEGRPREEILKETRWFQDPDQSWLFPISDHGIKSNPSPTTNYGVGPGSPMPHPRLHEAYGPDLDNIAHYLTVKKMPLARLSGGYRPAEGTIDAAVPSQKQLRAVLAHEWEHVLQHLEGRSRGSFPSEHPTEAARVAQALRGADMTPLSEDLLVTAFNNTFKKSLEKAGKQPAATVDDVRRLTMQAVNGGLDPSRLIAALAKNISHERYQRVLGEAGARRAGALVDVKQEDLLKLPLWQHFDRPVEKLTILPEIGVPFWRRGGVRSLPSLRRDET